MTDREKAIVMAYTGATMLTDDKFSIFHKYIEDVCGRTIYTHELADEKVSQEIKEKSRDDFIKLCQEETYACDCIRRQAVIDAVAKLLAERCGGNVAWWKPIAKSVIDDLPSVNPQEPKTDYKAFAEWVAKEVFSEIWDLNKNSFAEIACRKLEKLGIVEKNGDKWVLKKGEG